MGIESVKNHTSSYQRASENVEVKLDSVGASAGAQRAATELSGKATVSEAGAKDQCRDRRTDSAAGGQ